MWVSGRDDGSGEGRDMGGMTGEIKMSEPLYLKAFREIDGRDEAFFEKLCNYSWSEASYFEISPSSWQFTASNSSSRSFQIIPTLGTHYSHRGNITFPAWDPFTARPFGRFVDRRLEAMRVWPATIPSHIEAFLLMFSKLSLFIVLAI